MSHLVPSQDRATLVNLTEYLSGSGSAVPVNQVNAALLPGQAMESPSDQSDHSI